MPLLCELGWHRADPLARWNHGYYFSKCGRCGRDLVRTAFAGWQVPHGFKVVWQAKPPAGAEDVQLVPEQEAPVAAAPTEIQASHDRGAGETMATLVANEESAGQPVQQETAVAVEEPVAPTGQPPEETGFAPEVAPAEAEVRVEAPTEAEAEVEAEEALAGAEAEAEAEAEIGIGAGAETETEAGVETEAEAEAGTEAGVEPEAEAEGEIEAELPFDAPALVDEQPAVEEGGSTSEAAAQDEEVPAEEELTPAYTSLVDDPEPRAAELPIQEVLRQLKQGEVPERDDEVGERDAEEAAGEIAPAAAAEPPPAVEPAPVARVRIQRGAIPDFMNEDPEEDLLESMSHPPRREQPATVHEDETGLDDSKDRDQRAADEAPGPAEPSPVSQVAALAAPATAAAAAAADVPPATAIPGSSAIATEEPGGEAISATRDEIRAEPDPLPQPARLGAEGDPTASSGRAKAAVTIAASFGVVMLAAALMARPDMRPSQMAQQSTMAAQQAVQPTTPQPQETVQAKSGAEAETKAKADAEAEAKRFVTASLLNCRSSPAEQAKPVRRLRRGEPVQVLAMEPAWASVSHKGRQCWASSRYISQQEPL
jgi:hypothetical protein